MDIIDGLLCLILFGLSVRDVHGILLLFGFRTVGYGTLVSYPWSSFDMFLFCTGALSVNSILSSLLNGTAKRWTSVFLLTMAAGNAQDVMNFLFIVYFIIWLSKSDDCMLYFLVLCFNCGMCMFKLVCLVTILSDCVHFSHMFIMGHMNIFVCSGLCRC